MAVAGDDAVTMVDDDELIELVEMEVRDLLKKYDVPVILNQMHALPTLADDDAAAAHDVAVVRLDPEPLRV